MKKLFIVLVGVFAIACGNNSEANREDNTIEAEVQTGAGAQRNPQLKLDADSAENFEVDTVSSAAEIDQRQEQ